MTPTTLCGTYLGNRFCSKEQSQRCRLKYVSVTRVTRATQNPLAPKFEVKILLRSQLNSLLPSYIPEEAAARQVVVEKTQGSGETAAPAAGRPGEDQTSAGPRK